MWLIYQVFIMNDNNDAQLTINAIHPKHPVTTDLNRRSWLHKENITESYHDIAELLVIGGGYLE